MRGHLSRAIPSIFSFALARQLRRDGSREAAYRHYGMERSDSNALLSAILAKQDGNLENTFSSPPYDRVRNVGGIDDVDESQVPIDAAEPLTAYGADFLVDGLVKRLATGDIVIPTFDPKVTGEFGIVGFQRGFVWTKYQCDRFVESILLNLPVPGIFLVREPNGRFLVLDGQQRLRTLASFCSGLLRGKEFRLESVQDRWRNKTYEELSEVDRRRLDDSIIHATIVRQEASTPGNEAVYLLFERLNTGGTNLQPQEIRVALYQGSFLELLRELNASDKWQALLGTSLQNLKDQELVLRFFALANISEENPYKTPLKLFLNEFMARNRNLPERQINKWRGQFTATTGALLAALGPKAFRISRAPNAAIADSVMVGLSERLDRNPKIDFKRLRAAYAALLDNEEYQQTVYTGTASLERVRTRLHIARTVFERV